MNRNGPIIIIEDDADDRMLLEAAFGELGYANEVKYFDNGKAALEYLRDDSVLPFLILSDINMPMLSGLELRRMIATDPKLAPKCIPYLFFSTHASERAVTEAYQLSVQGFFMKPNSFSELVGIIRKILAYWRECYSPGKYIGDK